MTKQATPDMIERVARALCGADGLDPDESDFWWAYKELARAAIEAGGEPTADMIERGAIALCGHFQPLLYDDLPEVATYMERKTSQFPIADRHEAREIASAVLDAALATQNTEER